MVSDQCQSVPSSSLLIDELGDVLVGARLPSRTDKGLALVVLGREALVGVVRAECPEAADVLVGLAALGLLPELALHLLEDGPVGDGGDDDVVRRGVELVDELQQVVGVRVLA